jgi:hypothetical protein
MVTMNYSSAVAEQQCNEFEEDRDAVAAKEQEKNLYYEKVTLEVENARVMKAEGLVSVPIKTGNSASSRPPRCLICIEGRLPELHEARRAAALILLHQHPDEDVQDPHDLVDRQRSRTLKPVVDVDVDHALEFV